MIILFIFNIDLAALGLSCGTQDVGIFTLHCSMQDLLLQCVNS